MGYETLLEQIKAVCAWNSLSHARYASIVWYVSRSTEIFITLEKVDDVVMLVVLLCGSWVCN